MLLFFLPIVYHSLKPPEAARCWVPALAEPEGSSAPQNPPGIQTPAEGPDSRQPWVPCASSTWGPQPSSERAEVLPGLRTVPPLGMWLPAHRPGQNRGKEGAAARITLPIFRAHRAPSPAPAPRSSPSYPYTQPQLPQPPPPWPRPSPLPRDPLPAAPLPPQPLFHTAASFPQPPITGQPLTALQPPCPPRPRPPLPADPLPAHPEPPSPSDPCRPSLLTTTRPPTPQLGAARCPPRPPASPHLCSSACGRSPSRSRRSSPGCPWRGPARPVPTGPTRRTPEVPPARPSVPLNRPGRASPGVAVPVHSPRRSGRLPRPASRVPPAATPGGTGGHPGAAWGWS